jgi:hypothetical protein
MLATEFTLTPVQPYRFESTVRSHGSPGLAAISVLDSRSEHPFI